MHLFSDRSVPEMLVAFTHLKLDKNFRIVLWNLDIFSIGVTFYLSFKQEKLYNAYNNVKVIQIYLVQDKTLSLLSADSFRACTKVHCESVFTLCNIYITKTWFFEELAENVPGRRVSFFRASAVCLLPPLRDLHAKLSKC